MPRYLLSVWHDEPYDDIDVDSPDMQRIVSQVDELNADLDRTGTSVFGIGLHPVSSACVVSASAGTVSMTDGPYAETKEHMGGFWIIEAADRDTALEWAARATAACERPVELREAEGA